MPMAGWYLPAHVTSPVNWDDLRFVLAVAKAGSLVRAARALKVDHTTVARRIDAVEGSLGVRLFTRTTTGYVLTSEAEGLLPEVRRVEEAVLAVERGAHAHAEEQSPAGVVRVTSGETFGACYLAPRLATLVREHPQLTVELVTGGDVLDLGRREADVAVRLFRSPHQDLVVSRVGELAHALYASAAYLERRPVRAPRKCDAKGVCSALRGHAILTTTRGPNVVEAAWLEQITGGAQPAFISTLTSALVAAAREGAGIAVLPRYLGDHEPTLQRIPMEDEPREPIWITVHRDIKRTRRVRVVLDHLTSQMKRDRKLLVGSD